VTSRAIDALSAGSHTSSSASSYTLFVHDGPPGCAVARRCSSHLPRRRRPDPRARHLDSPQWILSASWRWARGPRLARERGLAPCRQHGWLAVDSVRTHPCCSTWTPADLFLLRRCWIAVYQPQVSPRLSRPYAVFLTQFV
jgi:hypothetical protein